MRVELGPRQVRLDPGGAVLLPGGRALCVADLHLGKGATFRARGLPVPRGTSAETLEALSRSLERHPGVETLWILGDLVHSRVGITPELVHVWGEWREAHPGVDVRLVEGNHDAPARRALAQWGLEVVPEGHEVAGIRLHHHPPAPGDGVGAAPSLAGHLHPRIHLREGRKQMIKAPCFWLRAGTLILPALGAFVDGARIEPAPGDRVFLPVGDQVLEVASSRLPSSARRG